MDSRQNNNDCFDWLNGKCKKKVNGEAQVSCLGTLVDDGTSHCGRSTGGRRRLDLYCISEWCLINRAEDRDGEVQIYGPTKELGPGQKQKEWRGELRPEKAAKSRIYNNAW